MKPTDILKLLLIFFFTDCNRSPQIDIEKISNSLTLTNETLLKNLEDVQGKFNGQCANVDSHYLTGRNLSRVCNMFYGIAAGYEKKPDLSKLELQNLIYKYKSTMDSLRFYCMTIRNFKSEESNLLVLNNYKIERNSSDYYRLIVKLLENDLIVSEIRLLNRINKDRYSESITSLYAICEPKELAQPDKYRFVVRLVNPNEIGDLNPTTKIHSISYNGMSLPIKNIVDPSSGNDTINLNSIHTGKYEVKGELILRNPCNDKVKTYFFTHQFKVIR